MPLVKTQILGVEVTSVSKQQILAEVSKYLAGRTPVAFLTIVTPNPEQIVYAQRDGTFRQLLNSADVALPDGSGVVWALKQLTTNNIQPTTLERIPGIEFMEELVRLAAEKGYPMGFIGGRNGVADKSHKLLKEKYNGLKGWAQDVPELEIKSLKSKIQMQYESEKVINYQLSINNSNISTVEYFEQLAKRIVKTQARIVFVGLGAPKQEYFISNLKSSFDVAQDRQISNPKNKLTTNNPSTPLRTSLQPTTPLILMSVGGAFEILSGKLPRAPQWMRSWGGEWLWRLFLQPRRLRRQIRLIQFFLLTLKRQFVIQ